MTAVRASSNAPSDLFEGTSYRALHRLGTGGMGEVWLVEHAMLGTGAVFAAKVMHAHFAADGRLVDRFRVEAEALGQLRHGNIVDVTDYGTTADGRPFLVMEYLRGRTLSDELAASGGRLSVLEAISYARQLLSALEAIHAAGLVHRDLKPNNIFICEQPEGTQLLKVFDFGVVRIVPDAPEDAPLRALQTTTGVVIGTPRYVSPEAALAAPADHRADPYSAGVLLYRLIAGRGPFDHVGTDAEVIRAHAFEPPRPPSHYAGDVVPPALDRVVLRLLSKNPADRYQSARELSVCLDELSRTLEDPKAWDTTARDPVAEPLREPRERLEPHEPARQSSGAAPAAIEPNGGSIRIAAMVGLLLLVLFFAAATGMGIVTAAHRLLGGG